ncbi:hypothetical protein [Rhizobium tumorigenes]|uniref:Uncharacterized protein n=1 Tax=Rhizobium tumorigenes TaxID=2041385 RepID=A0AAF1KB88_9HYPH|nr:hypothetical protein [Rhizobium tumorigenes]WFR98164.1 hypothetical protein PR017_21605 [Rhizobium tumorigenes]
METLPDLTVPERERFVQIGVDMARAGLSDPDVEKEDWVVDTAIAYSTSGRPL